MHGSLAVFLGTLLVLTVFWLAGAYAAYRIGWLTPTQMNEQGVHRGISYLTHFGMLNDVFTVHPMLALNAALFWPLWTTFPVAWVIIVVFAAAIGVGLNLWWARLAHQSRVKEAHSAEGTPTVVGYIHMSHTALILWMMLMMLLVLVHGLMHPVLALGNICIIVAHVLMGTHWPLKMLRLPSNPFGSPTRADLRTGLLCAVFMAVGISAIFCYVLFV